MAPGTVAWITFPKNTQEPKRGLLGGGGGAGAPSKELIFKRKSRGVRTACESSDKGDVQARKKGDMIMWLVTCQNENIVVLSIDVGLG